MQDKLKELELKIKIEELQFKVNKQAELLEKCSELISSSAPLGWAASADMDSAQEWEKRAAKLMQKMSLFGY